MAVDSGSEEPVSETVDRYDTGLRVLLTLLFFVIVRVV